MRRDPGCTVERLYVVPSALRSLSVVLLLSAVSGTVIATTPHSGPGGSTADAPPVRPVGVDLSGRIVLTSSTIPLAARAANAQTADAEIAAEKAAAKKAAARKAAAKKAAAKKTAAKKAAAERRAQARAKASRGTPRSAKAIARVMVAGHGWKSGQFGCLVKLWDKESGWHHTAHNSSSGAYGIPQSLPGSKMATAGEDWRTNPKTQIRWGLRYIDDRYGSPCAAWAHSRSHGWY
jgi:hypothetical protein